MSAVRRRSHGHAPLLLVLTALVFVFAQAVTRSAGAAPLASCGAGCNVTINALDFPNNNAPLDDFSFIVNLDNTKLPNDPLALSTESNSPVVAEGTASHRNVNLSDGRYLVSVRSLDHKMWGAYFTLPDDADSSGNLTVNVALTEQSDDHPLPLGKIRVFVFNDNTWANGAPDSEEVGLNGFQVGLEEQTGNEVTVDYNNDPLCGGVCLTHGTPGDPEADGFVEINNLGPATYFIDVHPPGGQCNSDPSSQWYQTTTIDGGLQLMAPTEEGADGTGAPGEQLWEPPNVRTAYWFGFVCAPQPFADPGSGEIVGTARNWVEWAPYTFGTVGDPVENPFVALSDASTDQTVFVGQGDAAGNFDIQGVPAGDYNLSVWDEQLTYIMRFKPVHVNAGATVDVNESYDDGSVGVGVSRWFGWLDGYVYKDLNNNGKFDGAPFDLPLGNTDVDQRWRDGSIKEGTFTDPTGYYEYPTAEGGALGRWIVGEQGFARFTAFPGASTHDEHTGLVTPSCAVPVPVPGCVENSEGGGLLMNNLLLEGHRSTVDWGKHDYAATKPGQIVGITYFATTRNEFDAKNQAHEDYEPAVPDVTVLLETLGGDGLPNTSDDVIVNSYVTDHWEQPSTSQDEPQSCNPIRDFGGGDITGQFNPKIGPNCLEVPLTGQQTKEGKFDGGYAFADFCPPTAGGASNFNAATGDCVVDMQDLVAGNYIVHVLMPKDSSDDRLCNPANQSQRVSVPHGAIPGGGHGCLYHVVREEDVNVDLGNKFAPQIPPPPCNGDLHEIDQSTLTPRSNFYTGNQATSPSKPLCDKHLIVLQNTQNANADFNLMTNFRTDPNGETIANPEFPAPGTGDVPVPGRVIGQVFNDIYFERNKMSPWYGEPRPIAGIPVGIYARVDTVPNVNQPFDPNHWRLITTLKTSADGSYEALLPSTETLNCPIPQGPCPGMYIAIVDDPGSKEHPNDGKQGRPKYNPNLLTANTPFDVWPGLTTQLDTPVDPISGTACQDPAGGNTPDPSDPARPDLLQVDRPYVLANDNTPESRRITIKSDFIGAAGPTGAAGGRIRLTDWRTGTVTTLTRGSSPPSLSSGGIVSWAPGSGSTPDTIVVQIPTTTNGNSFPPGPKQLTIVTSNANGAVSSVNGITLHVLGTNNQVTYTPTVVDVGAPTNGGHQLQDAIDAASAGSLLVLKPGTYNENILLWKPLKIQGLGPGGIIGAHELQGRDPEDPRFNIEGSIIDGRFYQENKDAFTATVNAHAPYVLPPFTSGPASTVLTGADITVVAKTTGAYDVPGLSGQQDRAGFFGARIDGLGLMTGHGDGAGGIQLQASINNMQITNNVLENNGGVFAGGIGVGQLYVHGSHNYDVRISNDRLIGNGGLTSAGGAGIFYGSNNYEVANSILCSNFSVEYGAGVSHIGLSPNASIHDNQIYYNDSVDSGAGIAIESELPVPPPAGLAALGDGSGSVSVDRNLIQSNFSGDDGGGIFVLDALKAEINIRNNMIVDNGAADLGGAVTLDDASNVRFINNTVANNVSTGSSENSAVGVPRSAGLASEANDPRFQLTLPATASHFSDPVALFNNIFWNNNAFTLDQFSPGAVLVDEGFIDFEIHDPTNGAQIYTNARYNLFTNGNVEQADGSFATMPGGGAPVVGFPTVPANKGNIVGVDPLFITPFTLELTVSGSRLDPQAAAVTITGVDPPVGLTGDYHLQTALAANQVSGAVDRGVRCSNAPVPPPSGLGILAPCTGTGVSAPIGANADIDGQTRPQVRTLRLRTPWDFGADEVPTIP